MGLGITRPSSGGVEDDIKKSSEDATESVNETNSLLQTIINQNDVIIRILNKAYETNEEIEHVNY